MVRLLPLGMSGNGPVVVIRADFDDPAEARDAMFELEGAGIDAVDIKLVEERPHVPPPERVTAADNQLLATIAERYGAGAVIGGVIGALVAMAVVAVLGFDPLGTALALAAALGGSAGFFFGGFFNVARRLPVNEDAYDTALVDPDEEPLHVEVRVGDERIATQAEQIISAHRPRAVRRERR